MIVGMGMDLCDISRIENTLEKYGERFPRRCFTEIERAKADGGRPAPPLTPSVSPPRRPAPRRSAPASARA